MISTALAIQDATGNAVVDLNTLMQAKLITNNRESMTEDEFIHALWEYSAHLASLTATLVSSVCLTTDQLNEMIDTIKEMEQMGKEAL